MNPIRKPFFGDPQFPFDLVYQAIKTPQIELPDHLHDRYELVYVYQGKGTFFIDKSLYEKNPGDVFIIPGNTIHRSFPDVDEPIISTALFFSPTFVHSEALCESYATLQCFELAKKNKNYKLLLSDSEKDAIQTSLKQIHEEMCRREFGFREAVRLHVCLLLLQVNRYNRYASPLYQHTNTDKLIGPHWMREALRCIDAYPEAQLGLAELAERAAVSPAHFSRVFKQLTGMNVTLYIHAKRIARMKELLRDTEETIATLAERCGFSSLPHFYRVFKTLTGETPRDYQRKQV